MAPIDAITARDGLRLVPLEPEDARAVMDLATQRGNALLVDLGTDERAVAGLLAQLASSTWALPMAILRGEYCIGMATTSLADVTSLTARVLAMFVEPPTATAALALYVRHVFWTFPLRRLHAQVPVLDLTREYLELYGSAGFLDEGRLIDHVVVAGQSFDVAALGLLRGEFDDWCAARMPELAL